MEDSCPNCVYQPGELVVYSYTLLNSRTFSGPSQMANLERFLATADFNLYSYLDLKNLVFNFMQTAIQCLINISSSEIFCSNDEDFLFKGSYLFDITIQMALSHSQM